MSATNDTVLAAFRVPPDLKIKADAVCEQEQITFSQLIRRGLRRELGDLPAKPDPSPTALALTTLDQLAAASRDLRRDLAASFAAADAALAAARQQLSASGQLPEAATQTQL